MDMSEQKKEYIYNQWETIEDDRKRIIFKEFKMKYRGSYTQQHFLTFLNKKLLLDFEQNKT